MRTNYPSDITREEFEIIRYTLEKATKTTHPQELHTFVVLPKH